MALKPILFPPGTPTNGVPIARDYYIIIINFLCYIWCVWSFVSNLKEYSCSSDSL